MKVMKSMKTAVWRIHSCTYKKGPAPLRFGTVKNESASVNNRARLVAVKIWIWSFELRIVNCGINRLEITFQWEIISTCTNGKGIITFITGGTFGYYLSWNWKTKFRSKHSKLRNQPDFPRPTQGPEQFREVRSFFFEKSPTYSFSIWTCASSKRITRWSTWATR